MCNSFELVLDIALAQTRAWLADVSDSYGEHDYEVNSTIVSVGLSIERRDKIMHRTIRTTTGLFNLDRLLDYCSPTRLSNLLLVAI